jgi:hypothetical protein
LNTYRSHNNPTKALTSFAWAHHAGWLRHYAPRVDPLIEKIYGFNMNDELIALKKYLARKKVLKSTYAVGTLPNYEGYCILESKGIFEIFYYERGLKLDILSFSDSKEAIQQFKIMVLTDPSTRTRF